MTSVFVQVTCKTCNCPIYRERGRINENKKFGHNFYCSRTCEYVYRTKKQVLSCDNLRCSKRFLRIPNDILEHNYCSRSCAAHINNVKFPKRGVGFKICAYAPCSNNFKTEAKYCSRQCGTFARKRHTPDELIEKVQQIRDTLKRTPAKREIKKLSDACRYEFGSWNNALIAAGMTPYRSDSQRMYKRRNATAKDGHLCDSISEVIVDNWLSDHGIDHTKNIPYPSTHHKADWAIGGIFVEYFGLAEDSSRYDRTINKKKFLCRRSGIPLVAIYPKDIYPQIVLNEKFKDFFPQRMLKI